MDYCLGTMDAIVFHIQDGGGFFSQSGVELKLQDGSAHESRPC